MKTLEQLAREAHDLYERLAPEFGYETRTDTRQFDPQSANGRLMMAVYSHIRAACRAEALEEAAQWQPIETAPRGSGMDGPGDTRHPDYVQPPKVLLWTREGPLVGYYDWYYHPGYGRGADPDESVWRDHEGGRTYGVTHWMPLPQPPAIREMK